MDDVEERILDLVKQADPLNPIDFVHNIVKDLAIHKMNEAIKLCQSCPICDCNSKTCGVGNPHAAVLFISETPEENGNMIHPLISKIIEAYSINKDQLFFINTVNCAPYQKLSNDKKISRSPSSLEVKNCKTYVDYAIRAIEPFLIILLGNVALNAYHPGQSIIQCHGQWTEINGIRTMPVYSPSFLQEMRNIKSPELAEEYEEDFSEDIRAAFCYLQKQYPDNDILLKKLEE